MRRLAPDLFNRRFDALIEAARSRLPSLAPRWTDYNAHDPGITLLELLAYVTEAQMYSLSRMRRDERAGYAALLGLQRQGPRPAAGSLWPDRSDPDSPFRSYQKPVVIEPDALVRTSQADSLPFHPTHRILWTAGEVRALRTLLADGRVIDLTQLNAQGTRAFEPFGPAAAAGDRLRLEYATLGDGGLFPTHRAHAKDAYFAIGVRVAPALHVVTDEDAVLPQPPRIEVDLRVGTERVGLRVVADGTRGFMQSGVLLVELGGEVPDVINSFALEFRASRGFARPPRILAIEPGVLPIEQGGYETAQPHAASGYASQRIELAIPGLRFGSGIADPRVVVRENGESREWQRIDDLERAGPDDRVYELDTSSETLHLGNGINGHLPEADSPIGIDYAFCGGAAGNTPRRQQWTVRGIQGVFGVNPDPITGGRDADGEIDLRRKARGRLRSAHALVTASDIVQAARGLPDLDVARAEIVLPGKRADSTRELVLIALRDRMGEDEPDEAPESARWLAAVRAALLPRMPLGTPLTVRAPAYSDLALKLVVDTQPRRNPAEVEAAIRQALRVRLALTPRPGSEPPALGAPVSRRDMAALIRRVPGVMRILDLELLSAGRSLDTLRMGSAGLPRLRLADTQISARRAGATGAP